MQLLTEIHQHGIGEFGATITEINDAESCGRCVSDDATYHVVQKAWLVLDLLLKLDSDELPPWKSLQEFLSPQPQHNARNLVAYFNVDWCDKCGAMVRCPRRGNPSCNGTYGKSDDSIKSDCPVCPVAFGLMRLINNAVPSDVGL